MVVEETSGTDGGIAAAVGTTPSRRRSDSAVKGVRAMTTLLALATGVAFLYVLLTPDGPNRLALRAAVGSAAIIILAVNRLVTPAFALVIRQGAGGVVAMTAAIAWITAWVALDGGAQSPLNATFILPLGLAVVGTPSAAALLCAIVIAGQLVGSTLGGPLSLPTSLVWASQFALVSVAISWVAGARLRQRGQLRVLTAELEDLATRDPLTRSLNRRGLMQALEALDRQRGSIAVLVADLDHFKDVNDRFGHARGDEVLVAVAEAIRNSVRDADVVARTGGEEFTIVLADTDVDRARVAAERVRTAVAQAQTTMRVTTSIGVVVSAGETATLDRLQVAADQAMYLAKEAGRDRVVVAAGTSPSAQLLDEGRDGPSEPTMRVEPIAAVGGRSGEARPLD